MITYGQSHARFSDHRLPQNIISRVIKKRLCIAMACFIDVFIGILDAWNTPCVREKVGSHYIRKIPISRLFHKDWNHNNTS